MSAFLYRVVGNWWYKRKGGDSTRKKKSKIENKNFSFEALFSRTKLENKLRLTFIYGTILNQLSILKKSQVVSN